MVKTVTTDRYRFEASLDSIKVHGDNNFDWIEPSMKATKLALEECLPGSDVYVFTDSPAKDYELYDDIVSLCQKKQIQVVFVLTEGFSNYYYNKGVQVFFKIAQACSGQAFVIEKNEVSKIPIYISETVKGTKNTITSKQIEPNKWTDIKFTIDDKTEYALVSMSGKEVHLQVNGPNIISEQNVWTLNVKVLKLINPSAGEYIARVWSSQNASVYVFGRTDFTFIHGFSELIPKSLKDTIAQPITGTKSHLTVSVTDSNRNVIIKIQILDMNENIIKEIPLNKISRDMYTTDALLWPTSRFKVAIIGRSIQTGKSIRRIANTPVEPQKPKLPDNKVPVATISEGAKTTVDYNGSLVLTCRVSAYPTPNIVWRDIRGNKLVSQSSAVELPYNHISYLRLSNVKNPGKYYCLATNNQGKSTTEIIYVNVTSPFTIEEEALEGSKRFEYGKEGILKCKVRSKLPMKIIWKHYDKITQKFIEVVPKNGVYSISDDETELKIISIDLYQDGRYTCTPVLKDNGYKGPTITKNVIITNLIRPLLNNKGGKIVVKRNETVVISCKVRLANPKPKIELVYRNINSNSYKFVNLSSSEELVIKRADLIHAGRYKCTAINVAGHDVAATELVVEATPKIINTKTMMQAVEDDLVLKIPCTVEGYPKPVVTWKVNGLQIATDGKFVASDDYLIINKPNVNDTNYYTCMATNKEGTDQKEFNVEVTPDLNSDDTYGKWHNVFLLENKPMNLSCSLPISHTDTVRWFLDGSPTNFTGKYLYLNNTTVFNDGNYTCRVSNKRGSVSQTYIVDFGYPPTFEQDEAASPVIINWNGDDIMIYCDVNAKPNVTVEWIYNGKIVPQSMSLEQPVLGWGDYKCRVSNVHGSVEKNIKVTSQDCLINRNNKKGPVIITDTSTLSNFGELKNYLQVSSGQKLLLSCNNNTKRNNNFENFINQSVVTVVCDHKDIFLIDDRYYTTSNLQCHNPVLPTIQKNGEKCYNKNSELIHVGFEVNGFIDVFNVCFDTINNIPLYTRVAITEGNVNDNAQINWFNNIELQNSPFDSTYNCVGNKTCCYAKRQLVNRNDVVQGPAQVATFMTQVNAVPVWVPCNKKDAWSIIENVVRNYGAYDPVTIWSGASKVENYNGKLVPKYLWKVVKFEDDDVKVIVHVNHPSPVVSDILCENTCRELNWMQQISNQFTYCCSINNFIEKFEINSNIFLLNV